MGKEKINEQILVEMIEMYAAGSNTTSIAARFGVDASAVQRRLRLAGVTLRSPGFQNGEDHHAWKGGRTKTSCGYVHVLIHPDDPFFDMGQVKADGLRYVPEHRLVMAKHLGRLLRSDETVHHVDGDKTNNALSNLQLRQGKHGKGVAYCCADCGSRNVVPIAIVAQEI